jgi:putative PEP-CTERM system histidine kinase
MISWIEAAAIGAGLVLAGMLALFPRFGAGSWHLLLFILPATFSAAVQAFASDIAGLSPQDSLRLAFALVIFASAGGYIAGSRLNQEEKRFYEIPICALAILLVMSLYFLTPPYAEGLETLEGHIALGLTGYASALFLLIVSVVTLAKLEQMLRLVTETVRWEFKFLFLGVGAFFAAVIYMSSQVLLYPPRSGLLSSGAMGLLHLMFLISCILIAISWKRGSGRARIAVSHGAIYSSITLLTVGVYLIASSLIARWASQYGDIGLPVEALIFLLSAVALAAVLLGTAFRHRTRAWIRRNIFAGRYDYRQFWLEATERVRSIDPPDATAAALAEIVHRALGAIDTSVWIRRWNPNCLLLLGSSGTAADSVEKEAFAVVEEMLSIPGPISPDDLERMQDVNAVKDFMSRTKASLLVPLLSSNRIVGVISVGSDRSGRPYDAEAREFLRALAGHAAGEFHKSDLLATLVEAKEDEAFRAFSTFVLHDLKNFASTLSYIAQNAPRHQLNPEFQKDAFQSVFDTAEKMKRLCNSLRTFSGTLAANKKPADINQIVRSAADNLNAGLSEHLKLDLGDLPPVMADAEELERVLQNLLLNAREAIAMDGAIIVRTADRGDRIELSVEDNGRGMSSDFVAKELFLPFRTTKSGGLGIGLFQSKKIVEAHGGSILVESEEGNGTIVRLILPKS